MLEDFGSCVGETALEAEVCIVGGGAAGVTLADALLAAGREVLLLESGGLDHEPEIQRLMEGENRGFPYYDLAGARLRFFGGSTAIWGGRCAQLNRIDFERRSWVPHSGWPISKDDLAPWYARAQVALGLAPTAGEDELWEAHGLPRPPWSDEAIGSGFWQFDLAGDRFSRHQPRRILQSPRVRILLHATATAIRLNAGETEVEALEIANLAGGRGRVTARQFVLAAGGIETPRLMLASADVQRAGVGNGHGLVGRFFMEHPHARGGQIETPQAGRLLAALPRGYARCGVRHAALARPGEALQRREGLLNSAFTLAARRQPGARMPAPGRILRALRDGLPPKRRNRALWQAYRRGLMSLRGNLGESAARAGIALGSHGLYAVIRAEQAPNPASRVLLAGERDALGMPRVALDWRLSPIDKATVRATMTAFDGELRRLGLGSCTPAAWLAEDGPAWETDPLVSNHPIGGFHHMGTTRMAATPSEGVVDADCRVHGLANLWIAGSSVFPTCGWANPTLTILALALRLADRLGRRDLG